MFLALRHGGTVEPIALWRRLRFAVIAVAGGRDKGAPRENLQHLLEFQQRVARRGIAVEGTKR